MRSIPEKQARLEFTHIVDEVAFRGERYIITRNGRKLMAMISMGDLEILKALENRRDAENAKHVEADIRKRGTVPWEEIEKRLGIDAE
jgi:PHD/YefM family antitoxin component YafN of YafNO toxin-antitoxin module